MIANSPAAMAPVALTSTGNSRAALMRPRAAAHKPAPAANKGALAARSIAEPETISVSPARKTGSLACRQLLPAVPEVVHREQRTRHDERRPVGAPGEAADLPPPRGASARFVSCNESLGRNEFALAPGETFSHD